MPNARRQSRITAHPTGGAIRAYTNEFIAISTTSNIYTDTPVITPLNCSYKCSLRGLAADVSNTLCGFSWCLLWLLSAMMHLWRCANRSTCSLALEMATTHSHCWTRVGLQDSLTQRTMSGLPFPVPIEVVI